MNLTALIQFVKLDMWTIPEGQLSPARRFLLRVLRIFFLTIKGFMQDDLNLRASSLTFYSLLSIAPVLALGFGIAKGFGFEKTLENLIYEQLPGQEQVATQVVDFAHALLENVKGGLVAGIGLIVLFYTVVKILSHIESAFNDVWGITRSRSLGRKITDYFSLMLICPMFFVVISALTAFLTTEVKGVVQDVSLFNAFSPAIFFMLKFLPYTLLWILFTFLYIFIPNTRVNFGPALLAGIIAATLHIVFQRAYIFFQIGFSRYNAIYGSFAAVPLFLIWLQISWLIVLLGSKLAFAHQNLDTVTFEKEAQTVSYSYKRLLALRIAHFLVSRFSGSKATWEIMEISRALEIPIQMVNQLLLDLIDAGVVAKVSVDVNDTIAYQPARDTDTLTIKSVIDALERNGSNNIPVAHSPALDKISESLNAFSELVESSPANQRLKDI